MKGTRNERRLAWYFAYGSNMDLDDLAHWCVRKGRPVVLPRRVYPARLENHQLCFNYYSRTRQGGAANVMSRQGETVYGLAMQLTPIDFATISMKEGAPSVYREMDLAIKLFDGTRLRRATTFQVVGERLASTHQPPTGEYLRIVLRSARRYGFPDSYIRMLESAAKAPS